MDEDKTLNDFNAAVDQVKAQADTVDELKEQNQNLEKALVEVRKEIKVLREPQYMRNQYRTIKELVRSDRDPRAWQDLVTLSSLAWKDAVHHDRSDLAEFLGRYPSKDTTDMTGVDYAIPDELYPEIWRVALQSSVFLQKARGVPTMSDNLLMPDREAGHTCYNVARGVTITAGAPEIGQIAMPVSKLACAGQQGIEAFDDSAPDLASFLMQDSAEALGAFIDTIGFTDASVGTVSGYTGVLPAASNSVDIAVTTFDPTFAEIWEGIGKLSTTQLRGAEWFMSPFVWSRINAMVDGVNGQPIWSPTKDGDGMGRFGGFPVNLVDTMPGAADVAVSTDFLLFGNLGNWMYADRQQFTFQWSDEYAFLDHARTWKAIVRIGFPVMTNATAVPACFVKWTSAAS